MTLNPFERVAVSLKLVSMLLHYSSPPATLVFAVFSWEQNLKRPLRMEFELQEIRFFYIVNPYIPFGSIQIFDNLY